MAFKTLGWDVPTLHDAHFKARQSSACKNTTQPPASKESAKGFAINIAKVPVDLTSSGVRHVCSEYGKLLHVVRITDTDWAVVHFSSISEATNAIKGLNASKTLGWHVKLAKADKSDKSSNADKSHKQHKTESKQKDMNWLRSRLNTSASHGSTGQKANGGDDATGIICNTLKTGPCVLCKSPTKYSCSQCFDFYCSDKCQQEDLAAHKAICFPIPDLVPMQVVSAVTSNCKNRPMLAKPSTTNKTPMTTLQKRLENLTITTKTIDSTHKAEPKQRDRPKNNAPYMITHIHNNHTVSIRSMEPNDDKLYLKLLSDCADYERTAKSLTGMPARGQMVLADFLGTHYRALVLKAKSEEHIDVMFVDFGNKEKKTLAQLKVLRSDLGTVQLRTYRVRLAAVDVKLNNERVMDYLKNLLDDCKTLKLVYDDEKAIDTSPVTLIDVESLEVINDTIAKLNGQT